MRQAKPRVGGIAAELKPGASGPARSVMEWMAWMETRLSNGELEPEQGIRHPSIQISAAVLAIGRRSGWMMPLSSR